MRRSLPSPDQPSLFGVAATDPTPGDLAGLLAGPGEVHRLGGTARVAVPVETAWRVHVLMAELAARELVASWRPVTPDGTGGYVVRTSYTAALVALADGWRDGAPAGLHLTGHAVRLWVAAAGLPGPDGYQLPLGPAAAGWPAIGAALTGVGLVAALVVPAPTRRRGSAGGRVKDGGGPELPAYRVTGRRRLARLAELVGDPPATAPPGAWPAPPGDRGSYPHPGHPRP